MNDNKKQYKAIMEFLAFASLVFGAMLAWSAMVGYNNGNGTYAIYAGVQATFFAVVAMVLSIMRATKRR